MPAIKICKRKWMIGSDDFVYSMFGTILFRIVWLILLIIVFQKDYLLLTNKKCEKGIILWLYYIILSTTQVFMVIFNAIIMYNSMKGTIMDIANERSAMPFLITGKVLLLGPEAGWLSWGTYIFMRYDLEQCSVHFMGGLEMIMIIYWMYFICLALFIIVVFDPLGGWRQKRNFTSASTTWERRCRMCFCVIPWIRMDNVDSMANTFAHFFYKSDLVLSDVLAGLILLSQEQSHRSYSLKHLLLPYKAHNHHHVDVSITEHEDLSITEHVDLSITEHNLTIPDQKLQIVNVAETSHSDAVSSRFPAKDFQAPQAWMTLENALYFMRFAEASYGQHCRILLCCCYNTICPCYKAEKCACARGGFRGDCCMSCFISRSTAVHRRDFIYADFENRSFVSPFYVVFDHKSKNIVISIRGTLSLEDTITDLTIKPQDMNLGLFSDEWVHGGILKTALNIQHILQQESPLDEALARHQNYGLVVTGHSLGAGVASLLAILLRQTCPKVVCYAFAPPGWLVSEQLAVYSETFIMSVLVGKDLVPRMGVQSMRNLKHHTMHLLQQCPIPKYQVFNRGILKKIFFKRFKNLSFAPMEEAEREQMLLRMQQLEEDECRSLNSCAESPFRDTRTLTLPGKLLYIDVLKMRSWHKCYEAHWAHRDFFKEIIISTDMFLDHLPNMHPLEAAIRHQQRGLPCDRRSFSFPPFMESLFPSFYSGSS